MSTAGDIVTIIERVSVEVLQDMGATDLASVLQAVEKLAADVAACLDQKKVNLPVQVDAADIAADVAEDAKFPKP